MFSLSEITEEANKRKEAISINVMKATVIIREIKITEDIKIDVNEGLNVTNIVFECAALICLCMRDFDINFSLHILHSTFLLYIKDLLLLSLY